MYWLTLLFRNLNTILIDSKVLKRNNLKKMSKVSIYGEPLLPTVVGEEVAYLTAMTPDSMRQEFISKVYSILWCQILFTSFFIGLCNQNTDVSSFVISQYGQVISIICMVCLFVMTVSLICFYENLKQKPYNWMYMVLYTILMTYLLGVVGVVYSSQMLLLGGITTLSIFLGLSLYAVQSKYDYTQYGNYLIIALFSLILFGFILGFTNIPILNTVYSVLGAMIFAFYIVYDTQLIVGGNHRKHQFSTDDYVIASISLYLDIINMFLYLMDLLNVI